MHSTKGPAIYSTHEVFSWDQAVAAMEMADRQDIERGGVYDAHSSAAISIWSGPWNAAAGEQPSELVGTIFWDWGGPEDGRVVVYGLQVGPQVSVQDVKKHVSALFGQPLLASVVA